MAQLRRGGSKAIVLRLGHRPNNGRGARATPAVDQTRDLSRGRRKGNMKLEGRPSQNFKTVGALALMDGEREGRGCHACRSLHINYPSLLPASLPACLPAVRALEGLDSQYTYFGRVAKFPASRSRSGETDGRGRAQGRRWQGSNRWLEAGKEKRRQAKFDTRSTGCDWIGGCKL